MAKKKLKILEIDLPKENFGRELIRVPPNEVHGEAVLLLHGDGKMFLAIYEKTEDLKAMRHKTHAVNLSEYRIAEAGNYKKDVVDLIKVENKSQLCVETKATLEKDGFIHVVIQPCSKPNDCKNPRK